ncbi:uncharacterized protein [Amphiura filiformis]|uniref:uncharacterized protein isoform X3 n=1 Tax=Amphiura filiformis TaxID=82378 RepID=UPI003B20EDB8
MRTLKVLTPILVYGMWVLVGLSRACTPPVPETTELKAYRADIIVEAITSVQSLNILATVTKTLKGDIGDQEFIEVSDFGTEEPCFWENTDLVEGTPYVLYLEEKNEDTGTYSIVGNPDISDSTVKRKIRRTAQKGGPPVFRKALKDRRILQDDKVTIKCEAEGLPDPSLTVRKDGQVLTQGTIKGVSIKHFSDNIQDEGSVTMYRSGIRLRVKSAKKLLHEGIYECVADNRVDPPVSTSLALSICALECVHGDLREKKCICICEQGWKGPSCDVPIRPTTPEPFMPRCNLDCGQNGVLNEELCICVCDEGFTGEMCREPEVCNITCGDYGIRNNDTCSCTCQSGYYGDDCSDTPESLCLAGTFCKNEGKCSQCLGDGTCYPVNETLIEDPGASVKCICSDYFMGDRCQYPNCQEIECIHGRVDYSSCTCICNAGYRGKTCHVAQDNHTKTCDEAWEGYCLNGGTCLHLSKLNKPSCRCPNQYTGDRCDLFDPDVTCYEGFCLNGGVCRSFGAVNEPPCICPTYYSSERCDFKRRYKSDTDKSTKTDSKKLIVTMTAIFVFMMLVIAIVVFIYIKNRSVRERERREHLNQMMKEQSNAYHHGGGTEAADDIQMRTFHNQQPETTSIQMESDTHMHLNPNPLSRPIRSNNNITPPPYPGFISLNGHHVSSKASIHSNNNSATSANTNSNHSSPVGESRSPPQGRARDGYEEIPGDEPSEVEMSTTATPVHTPGRGDPDTLPTQQSHGSSSSTSDDSEESSGSDIEGDTIDIPNPQIQAIENHIAISDRENSSGDYTWDEYNHNLRFSNPYAMDSSPVHKPSKQRSRLNGDSTQVNILENPIVNGGAAGTTQTTNLSSSPKDNIYNDRLKDVVETSPASAV